MGKKIRNVAKGVELWEESLLLIRCPKCGRENWAPQVATGTCCWCGYDARELLTDKERQKLKQEEKSL